VIALRWVVFCVLLLVVAQIYGARGLMTITVVIPTTGMVVAVGLKIFQDPELSTPLTEVDWGVMEPGSSETRTAYVQSVANVDVTLNMTTTMWEPPEAATSIRLTWDAEDALLHPGESVPVVFTLYISEDISGIDAFSFDIVLSVWS